jgi:hypothetical protein
MQDRSRQFDEIFLQRTAGPYIWVKNGSVHPRAECPFDPQEQTSSSYMLRSGSSRSQDCEPSERSFSLLLVHRLIPKAIEFFLDHPADIPPA